MKAMRAAVDWWNRFWFAPAPAAKLGLARGIFFLTAFCFYVFRDFSEWATAAPFWLPMWTFETLRVPVLPVGWLVALQTIWKIALLLSGFGLATRMSTIAAAILGTYLLGLPHNFGATQHYDTLVVFALWVMAFARAGDARSIDAAFGRRAPEEVAKSALAGEYAWPIQAMWVVTALMFFGAGTSKLRHSGLEWAFSDNLRLLLVRAYYHVSDGDPLTTFSLVVARHPWLTRAIAAGSLTLETCYIVTLFSRRLRPIIGVSGMLFFVGIRALMGPTFETYLVCGLLLIPWYRLEAAVLRVLYNAETYAAHAAPDDRGTGRMAAAASSPGTGRPAGH